MSPRTVATPRSQARGAPGQGGAAAVLVALGAAENESDIVSALPSGSAKRSASAEKALIQGQLEQVKKDMQMIRAAESSMVWDMQREEKQIKEEEEREEARQIMEWRNEMVSGLREEMEERTREQKIRELLESKDYQEFKRDWKKAIKQKEQEENREQLEKKNEEARFKQELQAAAVEDKHMHLADRSEDQQELRDIKLAEQAREKEQGEQERIDELQRELNFKLNQLIAAKENALKSLHFVKAKHKSATAGRRQG